MEDYQSLLQTSFLPSSRLHQNLPNQHESGMSQTTGLIAWNENFEYHPINLQGLDSLLLAHNKKFNQLLDILKQFNADLGRFQDIRTRQYQEMTKDMVKVELDQEQMFPPKEQIDNDQELNVNKVMQEIEMQKKENDKLGQSYKTIKNEIESKKIRNGPWRSRFGSKLEKLLKEIIQINYDQNLQQSVLDYVHQWAYTQMAQNTGKKIGEEEEKQEKDKLQKAKIATSKATSSLSPLKMLKKKKQEEKSKEKSKEKSIEKQKEKAKQKEEDKENKKEKEKEKDLKRNTSSVTFREEKGMNTKQMANTMHQTSEHKSQLETKDSEMNEAYNMRQFVIRSRPVSSVLTTAKQNFWDEYQRIWSNQEEEPKKETKKEKNSKASKTRPTTGKKVDEKNKKAVKKRPLTSVLVKPQVKLDWDTMPLSKIQAEEEELKRIAEVRLRQESVIDEDSQEEEEEASETCSGDENDSQYSYTYLEMPTQKVSNLMKDYNDHKRTLHNHFYPPNQRLQQYRRKQLIEEKEEYQIEQQRIIECDKKEKEQMVGDIRDQMLNQWKYEFKQQQYTDFEKETMEFELRQKIKKCKKKKKKKKKKSKKTKEKAEPPKLTPDYVPFSVENQYFKTMHQEVKGQESIFAERGNFKEYQASEEPWEQRMKQKWLANKNIEIQNKKVEEEMSDRLGQWKDNKRIRNEEFQRRLENNYMASQQQLCQYRRNTLQDRLKMDQQEDQSQDQEEEEIHNNTNNPKIIDYEKQLKQPQKSYLQDKLYNLEGKKKSLVIKQVREFNGQLASANQESEPQLNNTLSVHHQPKPTQFNNKVMLRPMSAMVYHQNHKELQRTQMKQVAQLKTRIASDQLKVSDKVLTEALVIPEFDNKLENVQLPDGLMGLIKNPFFKSKTKKKKKKKSKSSKKK